MVAALAARTRARTVVASVSPIGSGLREAAPPLSATEGASQCARDLWLSSVISGRGM